LLITMQTTTYNKYYKGFSLLELAIVLVVVAIIATIMIDIVRLNHQATDVAKATREKMAIIEQAMSQFVFEQQRLPCPSTVELAISDNNFGWEQRDGSFNCNPGNANMPTTAGISAGAVPFKTLGLDQKYSYDQWGKRLVYVVPLSCAKSSSEDASSFNSVCGSAGHLLEVQGAHSGSNLESNAAYVLLSAGKYGHGAINAQGGARSTANYTGTQVVTDGNVLFQSDYHDYHNLRVDLAGVVASINNSFFVSNENKAGFDDILAYRNRDELKHAAGIINSEAKVCISVNGQTAAVHAANMCDSGNADCLTRVQKMAEMLQSVCW
ncbi:MAG: type II secretion system protein, partial [Pseudomonadota bacterium]